MLKSWKFERYCLRDESAIVFLMITRWWLGKVNRTEKRTFWPCWQEIACNFVHTSRVHDRLQSKERKYYEENDQQVRRSINTWGRGRCSLKSHSRRRRVVYVFHSSMYTRANHNNTVKGDQQTSSEVNRLDSPVTAYKTMHSSNPRVLFFFFQPFLSLSSSSFPFFWTFRARHGDSVHALYFHKSRVKVLSGGNERARK